MDAVTIIVAMLVGAAIVLAAWLSASPNRLVRLNDSDLLALALLLALLDGE